MKFVRESVSAVTVRRVEQGAITVGDDVITENVVLFRDSVRRGWGATDIATISEADLADLLAENPEIVLLGTGSQNRVAPRELVFAMARRGIGFETMDTPAACRTFNILVSEDRDVAAVLILES